MQADCMFASVGDGVSHVHMSTSQPFALFCVVVAKHQEYECHSTWRQPLLQCTTPLAPVGQLQGLLREGWQRV